jgi:hypothetical protein
MSKVAVGSIPEKICYVHSRTQEVAVGCEWDISWYDSDDGPKTVKEKVTPAFPIEDGNAKSMATAKKWAEQTYYGESKRTSKTEVVSNDPVTGVRVLSLEQRGNGGRAYKVIIHNYYVDLREDVLMDTMLKVGIDSNGVLKGEFVWAKLGSQMKLVRVGSELHRLIMEFESKKDIKPVGKSDLEVGGIYQDRKKNKAIFIGYVNTVGYKGEKAPSYYDRDKQKPTFAYETTSIKKGMLFYEIYGFETISKSVKEMTTKDSNYQYKIVKSHSYIEKVDQCQLPNNLIEGLRSKALKQTKNYILEFTGHKDPQKNVQRVTDWYLTETIAHHSKHLNLCPYDGQQVELFDVKKYLLFS